MNWQETIVDAVAGSGTNELASEITLLMKEEDARSGGQPGPSNQELVKYVRAVRYVRARPWLLPALAGLVVIGLVTLGGVVSRKL